MIDEDTLQIEIDKQLKIIQRTQSQYRDVVMEIKNICIEKIFKMLDSMHEDYIGLELYMEDVRDKSLAISSCKKEFVSNIREVCEENDSYRFLLDVSYGDALGNERELILSKVRDYEAQQRTVLANTLEFGQMLHSVVQCLEVQKRLLRIPEEDRIESKRMYRSLRDKSIEVKDELESLLSDVGNKATGRRTTRNRAKNIFSPAAPSPSNASKNKESSSSTISYSSSSNSKISGSGKKRGVPSLVRRSAGSAAGQSDSDSDIEVIEKTSSGGSSSKYIPINDIDQTPGVVLLTDSGDESNCQPKRRRGSDIPAMDPDPSSDQAEVMDSGTGLENMDCHMSSSSPPAAPLRSSSTKRKGAAPFPSTDSEPSADHPGDVHGAAWENVTDAESLKCDFAIPEVERTCVRPPPPLKDDKNDNYGTVPLSNNLEVSMFQKLRHNAAAKENKSGCNSGDSLHLVGQQLPKAGRVLHDFATRECGVYIDLCESSNHSTERVDL